MKRVQRGKTTAAFQLLFATTLILCSRVLFRFMEMFGLKRHPRKLRAFREKMQAMEQAKNSLTEQIRTDPGWDNLDAMEDFVSHHTDSQSQPGINAILQKLRAMRQEHELLQAIRTEAGEDIEKAAEGYRKYIATHPHSHYAYAYLGLALKKATEWDASIKAFREAERLGFEYYREAERIMGTENVAGSRVQLEIGKVLHEKGDIDAAIVQYRQVISLTRPISEASVSKAFYFLGKSLNEQGKRREARAAWKQAAKLDSSKVIARKAKELLDANP